MNQVFEGLKNEMFSELNPPAQGTEMNARLSIIKEKLLVLEPGQIQGFYEFLGKNDAKHRQRLWNLFKAEYGPALTKCKQQPLSQQQANILHEALEGLRDTSTGAGYRKRRTKKRTRKSKRSQKRKSGRKTRSRKRRTRKRRY